MGNFEDIKKKMIEENEEKYGREIREEYGEDVYETSNEILSGLTEEQWNKSEQLRVQVENMLKELAPTGDCSSVQAMEMAKLHGQWASCFWPDGMYSPEAHTAVAQMYVSDPRFTVYYETIVPGGAEFLFNAVENYCKSISE